MMTTGPPRNKSGGRTPGRGGRPQKQDHQCQQHTDAAAPGQAETPRAARFVKLPCEVLARRDLTSTAKMVYAVIVDEMRGTGRVRIGIRRLQALVGMQTHAILRAVHEVEEAGLLDAIKPAKTGGRTTYCLPGNRCAKRNGQETPKRCAKRNGLAGSDRCAKRNTTAAQSATEPLRKAQHIQTDYIQTTSARARDGERAGSERKARKGDHRAVVDHWTATWSRLIGGNGRTPFTATDGKHVKTLLAAVAGDVERATRMIDLYIADRDPWLTENRPARPLGTLISDARLKTYLAATAAPKSEPAREASTHPLIEHATRRYPDDVAAHRAEWVRLANADADYLPVRRGDFASGAEARAALTASLNGALSHAE